MIWCLLEEFSLEVSGYLNPLDSDTDDDGIIDGIEVNPELNGGWITEPTNPDTDGDGWSDFTEIYNTITSPVSSDTDGDGVNDPADMAPLHNLVVKVTIKKAHKETSWIEWTPKMQVVVRDVERDSAVYSTKKWADQDQREFWFLIWFYWYTTAEWGEDENDFYFDVDDDDYSFDVEASAYYQVLGFLWDEEFLKTTFSYAPTGVGHSQEYYYESADGHFLSLGFESVGISRVNTIGVYANGSYYHGKYSAQEKMAVVQLDVTGSSTNFDAGANVILIPTSVFTNTKLHAVVEKAVDADGTVDWDSLPDCLKGDSEFVGIDRNNLDDEASEWIEFTITKSGCSPADAEAILLLALTSANESEGEIYLSDAGSTAELMNLPSDVLSVVPLYAAGIANDLQGDKPAGLWAWVVQIISNPLQALWGLICAIGEWLGKLIEAIVEAGMKLVEAILPGAMALIEAAVKAAILVFAYLMVAVSVILMVSVFLQFFISLFFVILIYGGSFILNGLYLEYINYNKSLIIQLEINWVFLSFLDLHVPYSVFSIKSNDIILFKIDTNIISLSKEIFLIQSPEISSDEDIDMESIDLDSKLREKISLDGIENENLFKSASASTTDSDNDGLPDLWEEDNAEIFADLFGSDPLEVGVKDLIVEVDYIEGFRPTSEVEEIFALIGVIIVGVMVGITWVTLSLLATAAGSDIISVKAWAALFFINLGMTLLAIYCWNFKPYESFYRITQYFSNKEGHSIHILYDPENSCITHSELAGIQGLEDFTGWLASDDELRLIESNFHDDSRQILNNKNLGVYILYIGNHEEKPLAPGKTDTDPNISEPFGAVICKLGFLGMHLEDMFWGHEYWAFAHELGHILHLNHNDDESHNFMASVGEPFLFPYPQLFHYDDFEWNQMDYIDRFSADK